MLSYSTNRKAAHGQPFFYFQYFRHRLREKQLFSGWHMTVMHFHYGNLVALYYHRLLIDADKKS